MVFMPPQHGKSTLVSQGLPADILGHYPDEKIIAASYAATLAERMNREVQRIIDSDAYRVLFPGTQLNSKNIRTVAGSWLRNNEIFEIVGRRGAYKCAGVGGALTGFPADAAIIDDPYKDYAEAKSVTVRNAVWEWYTSVFLTRTHSNTRILLTQTRWHELDLAGMLLATEPDEWTVLKLPAICEDPEHELVQVNYVRRLLGLELMTTPPRKEGEALWSGKFDVEHLLAKKRLNPHQFEALYQQNPKPREGGMFEAHWFEIVDAAPADAKRVRRWDLAHTEGSGDYTVGARCSFKDGIFYIEDIVRGQWGSGNRDKRIVQTTKLDHDAFGGRIEVGIPTDPSAGKSVSDSLTLQLAGHRVYTEHERGDKETRADALASAARCGNVRMVRGTWNAVFLEEIAAFPFGGHDDQIDPVAAAYNRLALGPKPTTNAYGPG